MATWPDIDEMETYIGELGTDQVDVLEASLNAAVAYIGYLCDGQLESQTTQDTDGNYEEIVPENIREATRILASRLFRRRLSPEGVAGFGDFGAVRVISRDPDIAALITPQRSWGIA